MHSMNFTADFYRCRYLESTLNMASIKKNKSHLNNTRLLEDLAVVFVSRVSTYFRFVCGPIFSVFFSTEKTINITHI